MIVTAWNDWGGLFQPETMDWFMDCSRVVMRISLNVPGKASRIIYKTKLWLQFSMKAENRHVCERWTVEFWAVSGFVFGRPAERITCRDKQVKIYISDIEADSWAAVAQPAGWHFHTSEQRRSNRLSGWSLTPHCTSLHHVYHVFPFLLLERFTAASCPSALQRAQRLSQSASRPLTRGALKRGELILSLHRPLWTEAWRSLTNACLHYQHVKGFLKRITPKKQLLHNRADCLEQCVQKCLW